MAIVGLEKVRQHNEAFRKDAVNGSFVSGDDLRETLLKDAPKLAATLTKMRAGNRQTKSGRRMAPSSMTFSEMLSEVYGLRAPKDNKDGMATINMYLKQLGVDPGSFSIGVMHEELTGQPLNNVRELEEIMLAEKESFLTTDIASGTTFVIREVIMEAVRLGYLNNSQHMNWVNRTKNISQKKVTNPMILKGNARPRFIEEGEDIEFGTIQLGQKEVSVRKVGTGLEMTDELVFESSIDSLAEYLLTVGEDMGISTDVLAIDVLKNGEQASLSESCPVIGSESGSALAWKDIVRVVQRMRRLGHKPSHIISQEGDGLDMALLAEFKGFDGVRMLSMLNSLASDMPNFNHNIHGLISSGYYMFLDASKCMNKLAYRTLRTERDRNPKSQKEQIYITDFVGFEIVRRDARVMINKGTAYSGAGFPTWMDVDGYQNNPFIES